MQKLRFWIRNTFGFSQRETSGFIVVILLLLLLLIFPFAYERLLPPTVSTYTTDKATLDSLVALLEAQAPPERKPYQKRNAKAVTVSLFDFDPNQIDAAQWQSLGLPKYLAERIIKYRSKGGKFRVKKDLQKIYGFPEKLYAQLYPHILLPDAMNRTYPATYPPKEKSFVRETAFKPYPKKEAATISRFNLNAADTVQLKQIKGIGSGFSKRIIKYRDLLGGFVSAEQVREVYGLDSTVADELLTYAFVEGNQPFNKLRINVATAEELDAHPYISPKLAKVMVAYRQQHGKYGSLADLYNIRILDKATLTKLTPYLSFE